jgi:hypothetical protein
MYYQTYNPRKQPPTQSALKGGSSSLRQSGANAKPVVNIKRTLNKISKANYEVLITQLAEEIKTPAYNELEIIDALVNKIWSDDSFYEIYINICKTIMQYKPTFKKSLLNRCQEEFSKTDTRIKEYEQVETSGKAAIDIQEDQFKIERKLIGTVKFIGYLYNMDLINEKILGDCIYSLLKFDHVTGKFSSVGINKKHIECVDQLISVVNKKKLVNKWSKKYSEMCISFLETLDFEDKRIEFLIAELILKFP